MIPVKLDEEKFWARVQKTDDCWEWMGYRDKNGYGRVGLKIEKGWRPFLTHRVAWYLTHGDLPPELDHLCRNTSCCRPDHLEDVLHIVNSQRALVRETCQRGHQEWYIQPDGRKRCRACIREYDRVHVPPSRADDEYRRMKARERQRRYYQRKNQRRDAGES